MCFKAMFPVLLVLMPHADPCAGDRELEDTVNCKLVHGCPIFSYSFAVEIA